MALSQAMPDALALLPSQTGSQQGTNTNNSMVHPQFSDTDSNCSPLQRPFCCKGSFHRKHLQQRRAVSTAFGHHSQLSSSSDSVSYWEDSRGAGSWSREHTACSSGSRIMDDTTGWPDPALEEYGG